MKLHAACRQEAEWWHLKSRCKWLKDSDRNTRYFHKLTEARKCHNRVLEIQVDDRAIGNFEEIKIESTSYFSELFTEQPTIIEGQLLNLVPSIVKSKENDNLKKAITLEEIKDAVDNMEEDRAPGPDGFNVNFIISCWDIIKKIFIKND